MFDVFYLTLFSLLLSHFSSLMLQVTTVFIPKLQRALLEDPWSKLQGALLEDSWSYPHSPGAVPLGKKEVVKNVSTDTTTTCSSLVCASLLLSLSMFCLLGY